MRAAGVLFVILCVGCSSSENKPLGITPPMRGPICGHGALDADPHNCGQCGHDCAALPGIDGSSVKCNQGVCEFTCTAGRAHCSSNADDGCEADLSSPQSCGACGNQCSDSCAPDQQGSYQCQNGCGSQTSCGGSCTDLSSDPSNCGACGQICAPPSSNGQPTCSAGACGVTCDSGYSLMNGDCVADPNNMPGPTSDWTPIDSGTFETLYGVWGSPAGDLFVTGDHGTVLQAARGGSFNALVASSRDQLIGVWGVDKDNVLSVGWNYHDQQGAVFRPQSDGSWSGGGFVTPTLVFAWGSSATDIYTVGQSGTIMHNTGDHNWASQTTNTTQTIWAIWGSGASDVYAVGGRGTLLHSDGSGTWTKQTTPDRTQLNGVYGASATDVWAVGNGGLVLHSSGDGNWSVEESMTLDDLFAVGGAGSDVFAVGGNGTIVHRVGGTWTYEDSGTDQALYAVWASTTDGAFVVGDLGTILHH